MFFESSRIRLNTNSMATVVAPAFAERQQVQETPPRHRQQARQRAMQRRQRPRMTADEVCDHRDSGEDTLARRQGEAGATSEIDVFARRSIAGMLELRRGADQPSAQQKL